MKTKHFITVIIIIAVIVVGYYVYKARTNVGVNPDIAAWEKAVAKEIAWMKNDPKTVEFIKAKAKEKGISFEQTLRQDAEYYASQKMTKPV